VESPRVSVLGPIALYDASGVGVDLVGQRKRALLAMLAMRRGRPVPTEVLTEAVWGGDPPATAATALRVHVGELRKALAAAGHDLAGSLVNDDRGYALDLPDAAFDTGLFESLAARARQTTDLAEAFARSAAALGLWRATPFPELANTHLASGVVGHLEQLRAEVFSIWAEAGLGSGRADAILGALEVAWRQDVVREDMARLLMLALYTTGRQADALDVYARTRSGLAEALGLEPGPELRDVERAILAHDVGLERRTTPLGPEAQDPLDELVGRIDDCSRLVKLLQPGCLVSVVGAPGVGKTAIARSVTDDTTIWVDLAAVDDPTTALASTFDVADSPLRALSDSVADRLANETLLVVLDNAEHTKERTVELVQSLRTGAPLLRLLITSREALGVANEQVVQLGPLDLPAADAKQSVLALSPAVKLLERRIVAAGAKPVPSADLSLLAHICRQVDGLPLAIELAAVVVVDQGLQPGSDGLVDALMRSSDTQLSLEATVAWSLDALSKDERGVFKGCSVFPSWFGSNDAGVVVGPAATDHILDRLASASLFTKDATRGDRAYRMLAPLREVGRTLVANPDEAGARHARHIGSAVAGLVAPTRQKEGARAEQEEMLADIAVALDWFEAHPDRMHHVQLTAHLWPYWYKSGRVSEGRGRLGAALAGSGGSDEARCDSLIGAALFAVSQGDYASVREHSENAMAIGASDTRLPVMHVGNAALAWIEHRLEDADQHLGDAIEELADADADSEAVVVGTIWATVAWFAGREPAAAKRFHDVTVRAIRADDWTAARMARRYEALMLALAGAPGARAAIKVVLDEDAQSSDPLARCHAHAFMGLALAELGDLDAARPLLERGFRDAARVLDVLSLLLSSGGLLRLARANESSTAVALWLGWIDTMAAVTGLPLPHAEAVAIDDARLWAKATLGGELFDAQHTRGASLGPLGLIDEVLGLG